MFDWLATAAPPPTPAPSADLLPYLVPGLSAMLGMGVFRFLLTWYESKRLALKEDRALAEPWIQSLLNDRDLQIKHLQADCDELETEIRRLQEENSRLQVDNAVTERDLRAARNQLMRIYQQYGDKISLSLGFPNEPRSRVVPPPPPNHDQHRS